MPDSGRVVVLYSGGGTGGHLYPALNLASALGAVRPDVHAVFVGAERGVEARVLPERGVDFHLLPVRGVARKRFFSNLRVLPDLLRSLTRVASLFRRHRPRLVVVTGGYAGGPAGLSALLFRVPLFLQEQNAEPGVTTRILSLWARETHLAFEEARSRLPRRARARARLTGNPVSPPPEGPAREALKNGARAALGVPPGRLLLLVVGGSQGSMALNRAVLDWVRRETERMGSRVAPGSEDEARRPPTLLWSTGPAHRASIHEAWQAAGAPSWVRIQGYIRDMDQALAAADLALSRAGAMATSEFLAWGLPAVLVPLPTSAADHQTKNAAALATAGAAVHLPESELSGPALDRLLEEFLANPDTLERLRERATAAGRPHAARTMAEAMARYLPSPREAA